jgi:hypothetical protein
MLTLAVEDPPIPRRSTFVDGFVRLAAATVLLGSVIGVGYVAVFAWVDQSLFGEWQVILIALLLAGMLVGLALGSWFLLRSRHLARGRTSYLRLAVLALVPGLVLGLWISAFIIGSLVLSWIRHSSFGNPNGPGVLTLTSAPAPPSLASRMLTPTDVGAGWYNKAKPNPSQMSITAAETNEGQLVRVKDFIDREHWTGVVWQDDGTAIEVLLHFDSAAQAHTYPAVWNAQNPGATLSPERIGQTVVMGGATVTDPDWRFAAFVIGDNYFEVREDNLDSRPTAAQFQTVVAAAVAKATATP